MAIALLVLTLVAKAEARAVDPCDLGGSTCTTVSVPLDRTGTLPGVVRLQVQRFRARRPTRPPVFVFAPTPGAAVTRAYVRRSPFPDFPAENIDAWISPERRGLVLIDLRGTGGSGLLRCPQLQRRGVRAGASAARDCAGSLGARAAHFSMSSAIDDAEAVRAALHLPKIALFGDGFGAGMALGYARRYPGRVERVILHAPWGDDSFDPTHRTGRAAAARVLRSVCGRRGCPWTADPVEDLARLSAMLEQAPLVDRRASGGRGRRVVAHPFDLWTMLASGGSDLFALARLPGEIHSAVTGDPRPLLRSLAHARARTRRKIPARRVSFAAAAGQLCDYGEFPWPTGTPVADRPRYGRDLVAGLPPDAFAPFSAAAALGSNAMRLCRGWPHTGRAASAEDPIPDVPTLVIAGSLSLRAPIEVASALAAAIPQAQRVYGIGLWDRPMYESSDTCVWGAIDDFLAGRAATTTCQSYLTVSALPPPPRDLDRIRPLGASGLAGRTANAVRLTLGDWIGMVIGRAARGAEVVPGLRHGRYLSRRERQRTRLILRHVAFVPGVRVTGWVDFGARARMVGRLRVGGVAAARGSLTVRGARMFGWLGGRPVTARLTRGLLVDSRGVANGY